MLSMSNGPCDKFSINFATHNFTNEPFLIFSINFFNYLHFINESFVIWFEAPLDVRKYLILIY